MALGDSYATIAELKSRLGGVSGSSEDTALTNALASASRDIEKYCRRQFNKTTSATARVFNPTSATLANVDDFHTTTDLVIAFDTSNGTYTDTLSSSDYQLEPLNGIVSGESGWPYSRIRIVTRYFPCYYLRAPIQVTAQWGWNAVPASVKEACLALAEETYKLKDAPFGVAGFGDMGVVRIRENPKIAAMLTGYRLDPVLVA